MAARDGIRESACDGERVGGRRVGRYGAEQDTGIDRSSTRNGLHDVLLHTGWHSRAGMEHGEAMAMWYGAGKVEVRSKITGGTRVAGADKQTRRDDVRCEKTA